MKKVPILLLLCVLCLCSVGQGTAYITQCDLTGYPEIIRQYKNLLGHHVIYYTDIPEGWKGYVGLTDAFNNVITSINEEIHPYSSGFSVIVGISSLPQNDPVSTIIRTICH